MTGSPADQPEAAQEAASGTEQPEQATSNDALVEQTAAWLGQIASASGELARLFRLEWQLTLGDAKRVLLLGVLLVPLLLFAWLMFSALVGWAVWHAAGSVGLALAAMLVLQLVCIAGLVRQIGIYQRSQGFRRTRAHLKRLLQGAGDEKAATDSGD